MQLRRLTLLALATLVTLVAADVCSAFNKPGEIVSPNSALACLRGVALPDNWSQNICPPLIKGLEVYSFVDQLKTGGEFPETAVDFRKEMHNACYAQYTNTFDFHMALTSAGMMARDGHTGWVAPASVSVFNFVMPFTLGYTTSQGPEGEVLIFTIEEHSKFAGNATMQAQYDALIGEGSYATLSAAFGKTITHINAMDAEDFLVNYAEAYVGSRTKAQRFGILVNMLGSLPVNKFIRPEFALNFLRNEEAFEFHVADGSLVSAHPVAVVAHALEGVKTLEELEFPSSDDKKVADMVSVLGSEETRVGFRSFPLTQRERETLFAPLGAKNAGSTSVISEGTHVRTFLHADSNTCILQIHSYAPPDEESVQWLDELDAGFRAIKKQGCDDAEQGGKLLVDVRCNPGGLVDYVAQTVDHLAAGHGLYGFGSNIYPRNVFRVFNRRGLPGDKAHFIYMADLPLLRTPIGEEFHEEWMTSKATREFLGRGSHSNFTSDAYTATAFYTNAPAYMADPKRVAYKKVRGEVPAPAFDRLIEMSKTDYKLRNTRDNTVVAVGPLTASGGADTAHGLKQGNAAKVISSSGRPGVENWGVDQVGLVPGGDCVFLKAMVFAEHPDAAKEWGALNWPTRADFKFSNFAIMAQSPRARLRTGDLIREFTKEPADDIVIHANPFMGQSAIPEHSWGTVEDANAYVEKVLAAGVFDRCYPGQLSVSKEDSFEGTYVGRTCVNGEYSDDLELAQCKGGYRWVPPVVGARPHGTCELVSCPDGFSYDPTFGWCAVEQHHTFQFLGGIVVGVAIVTAVVVALMCACKKRVHEDTLLQGEGEENV